MRWTGSNTRPLSSTGTTSSLLKSFPSLNSRLPSRIQSWTSQAWQRPRIALEPRAGADEGALWTLAAVNPDGNPFVEGAGLLHWLLVNIPASGDVADAEEVVDYLPPLPFQGALLLLPLPPFPGRAGALLRDGIPPLRLHPLPPGRPDRQVRRLGFGRPGKAGEPDLRPARLAQGQRGSGWTALACPFCLLIWRTLGAVDAGGLGVCADGVGPEREDDAAPPPPHGGARLRVQLAQARGPQAGGVALGPNASSQVLPATSHSPSLPTHSLDIAGT